MVLLKHGEFPSGQVTPESSFKVFSVDRHSSQTDRFYQFGTNLSGLNFLRSTACAPVLGITPDNIIFPRAFARDAQAGVVASSATFNLTVTKLCNKDGFYTQARLIPVTATEKNGLLVPDDNDSVGIALEHHNYKTRAPLNTWFQLHGFSYRHVQTMPFQADLIWRTGQPKTGPFNAGLIVELTHY